MIGYRKDHFGVIVQWGGFDFQAAIGVSVVGYLRNTLFQRIITAFIILTLQIY